MNYAKNIVIFFVCMVLLGCSHLKGIKYKNSITNENTDKYSIYIETPCISGSNNKTFEDETNNYFYSLTVDWLENFKTRVDPNNPEKAELSVISDIKHNKNDISSIVMEKNVYMGGAHGNIWRISENIDFASLKTLRLSDLFIDSGYIEFLNRRIDELIKENPEEYSDLWQIPTINERQQKDFYIYDGNIVIFYQPYDLSYYAKGFVEFPISIESLRGYINPEYAEKIIK